MIIILINILQLKRRMTVTRHCAHSEVTESVFCFLFSVFCFLFSGSLLLFRRSLPFYMKFGVFNIHTANTLHSASPYTLTPSSLPVTPVTASASTPQATTRVRAGRGLAPPSLAET